MSPAVSSMSPNTMSDVESKSRSSTKITFVDIPLDVRSADSPGHINPAFNDPYNNIEPENSNNDDIELVSESRSSWKRLQLARAKLKMATKNSALLAGFAMVPMVELSIQDDEDDPIPLPLLMSFGIITTALVAVHLSAVMIASCILPYIDSIALSETETSDKENIQDSPHDKMHIFIEMSWMFSNVVGLILFLIEIILLSWVKFWQIGAGDGDEPGKQVALASTVTLLVCIGFFIWFAIYFYKSLADHEYERFKSKLDQVETGFDRKRKLSVWAKDQFRRKKTSIKKNFGRRKSSIAIASRSDTVLSTTSHGNDIKGRRGKYNGGFEEKIV